MGKTYKIYIFIQKSFSVHNYLLTLHRLSCLYYETIKFINKACSLFA